MKRLRGLFLISIFCMGLAALGETRPNILWFVVDDMSANFSCYGEKAIETPNVDKLGKDGLLFTRAYATSPVCSTFRTALITGMYQNSIGLIITEVEGENNIQLPTELDPFLKFSGSRLFRALVVD